MFKEKGQKDNKRFKKKTTYSAPNASPAIPNYKMGWKTTERPKIALT